MSNSRHVCNLPVGDDSGLPRLAPNVHWSKKLNRYLRKLILINPHHHKCKKLFRNNAAILKEKRRHVNGPYFFVIHPLSVMDAALELMFVILWLYLILVEPPLVFTETYKTVMNFHKIAITPLQLILILLFFNRGYIDTQNRIVLEPKKIICRYLSTYFIFDYLSTYLSVDIPGNLMVRDKPQAKLLLMTAYLIRIASYGVRIPALIDFLYDLLKNIKIKKTLRIFICHIIKTFLLLHITSFTMFILPMLYYNFTKNFPRNTWLRVTKRFKDTAHERYFITFRLVFCFFFGVPEIMMEVWIEQICAVVITIFGRLYTLYLLADILRVLGIVGVSESLYQGTMSSVEDYMSNQGLTDSLKERILKYCRFKFQGRYFQEKRIKNTLSDNLRTELFFYTAKQLTQKVDLFRSLPRSTVEPMMEAMKSEIFGNNDIIIPIGSEISEIYFISTGTVAVKNSSGTELCHLGDGEVFGISCLFFNQQKYAIVAVEETEVFAIGKNELMEFLYPYPGIMNTFYRSARDKIEKLKKLGQRINVESINLLTELQGGHILEKPVPKPVIVPDQ